MAKIQFIEKRFSGASLDLIETANRIIAEYDAQGLRLSIRQLYYQMVARDYIENNQRSYKRVVSIISDARNAGLVDWDSIEDRNREAYLPAAWESPAHIVRAAANQFRLDRWEGQENYIEIMVEKDALSGILAPICNDLHVRFSANKGYSSSSMMFEAGQRIRGVMTSADSNASEVHIFYLGDHDPSGIDMTRDVRDRLTLYAGLEVEGETDYLQVHRLALNMDQVEQWNPPPNFAKKTDSRFQAYKTKYGNQSWELDAVEPVALRRLILDQIEDYIDRDQWEKIARREKKMKGDLEKFAADYLAGKNKKTKGK